MGAAGILAIVFGAIAAEALLEQRRERAARRAVPPTKDDEPRRRLAVKIRQLSQLVTDGSLRPEDRYQAQVDLSRAKTEAVRLGLLTDDELAGRG